MVEPNRFIEGFRQEAQELLVEIEAAVLDIEENPEEHEAVNRLFRAMHTIKGSGAMFGFDDIAKFAHHVETALDKVRGGLVPITRELIDLTLSSRDQIKIMLEASATGEAFDQEKNIEIINALKIIMGEGTELSSDDKSSHKQKKNLSFPEPEIDQQIPMTYRIRLKPSADIFKSGMDPALLIEDLKALGECKVIAQTELIPDLALYNPELCYLFWDITLTTAKDVNAIKDVFIFVEDDCDISIEIIEKHDLVESLTPLPRLGEILIERGDTTKEIVDKTLAKQKRIGEILIENGAVSPEKVKSALSEQEVLGKHKPSVLVSSVRVPSDRLDKLINLVGELVITQARLSQVSAKVNNIELSEPVEEVERLTGELRDNVLNIRMMPIGTTFSKFRRLVRDLSGELGKKIDLVTYGAETEMDKTVLERLDDPLVHLIRNCIDHGIQSPEERKRVGKSERGTITLSAHHRGTNVVIKISDDGSGLKSEVIRKKAEEKGLITSDQELSRKEMFALIFAPGFSTAESITNVSGRGVGMDVVKKTIESLRGSIEIDSITDQGTTITLILPLTLAIIHGLLVTIGNDFFVLPLMTVEECVEMKKSNSEKNRGRNILNVRGEIVPYIRLRDNFKINCNQRDLEHVVIADVNGRRIGFVVDNVIGGHQTVIKSLGPIFANVRDISGATILGDGTVALILDTNVLLEKAMERLP
ncbi:MAG: chemotaxis protein CheA [Desulfamplus sp.]|nr:chemotaxis protein CheA [Desulfamplus sp.]